MFSSDINSLINLYKEELKKFYSLAKRYYNEKVHQKKEIMKLDINESKKTINLINLHINVNIEYYKKLLKIKKEISKETQIKNELEKKSKKIKDVIEKGKKILIKDIPYFEKLPEYANKKLKTAKLSPLDLINFTLRLSQQSKAPPGSEGYFNNFYNVNLNNDQQKEFNLNSFYIKNKNRYLLPYPTDLDLGQSILRYDFSEEKRLQPPRLIYPDPKDVTKEGFIKANNGSSIQLKYPSENSIEGIFFKYSKDINIIPSSFTGEEYKDYSRPVLDKDCIFKACSCKKGFKDSKIITFKFVINKGTKDISITRQADTKPNVDVIIKQKDRIDTNSELALHYIKSSPSFNESKEPKSPKEPKESPNDLNRPGTSHYEILYFNPQEEEEDEEKEDLI